MTRSTRSRTAHDQALELLDRMEIAVIPTSKGRRDGQTCAVSTVARLIEEHGPGHACLVLRTIAESEGNARQLIAPTIWAISDLALAHPDWVAKGLDWLQAFDDVDLATIVHEARLNRDACPLRPAISTILHVMLRPAFDPKGKLRRRQYRPRAQHIQHQDGDIPTEPSPDAAMTARAVAPRVHRIHTHRVRHVRPKAGATS